MSASGTNFNVDLNDVDAQLHQLRNHINAKLDQQQANAKEYTELLFKLKHFQRLYLSDLPDVLHPYHSIEFIENAVLPTQFWGKSSDSYLLDLMRSLFELTVVAERNITRDNKAFGDLVLKAFMASSALGGDMVTAMIKDKDKFSVSFKYPSYPQHMMNLIATVKAVTDLVAAPTNPVAIKKLTRAIWLLQYFIEPDFNRVLREKPILSALLFTTTALTGLSLMAGGLLLLLSAPSMLLIAAASVTLAVGLYSTLASSGALGVLAFQNLEVPQAVTAVKERASLARMDYKNLLSSVNTLFAFKSEGPQSELLQPLQSRNEHGMTFSH